MKDINAAYVITKLKLKVVISSVWGVQCVWLQNWIQI